MISETANAIIARQNGATLRTLAADLYDDAGKAGLLADIRNGRAEHVSHAALHDLRRRLGLPYDIRHIVDVPADHDAAVHLLPQGNGTLHTYTVPADAEVVIVPAGARIVQPKPAAPRRERKQKDVIRLSRAGLSDGEIDAILWASTLRPKEMFEFAGEILDAHNDKHT